MSILASTLMPRASEHDQPAAIGAEPLRVRHLSLEEWQQFVERHPDSTVFHHRAWIELLTNQYGGRVKIPAVLRGDVVVTAIPLVEAKELLGGRKLISLPFSDCVPVLWSPSEDAAADQDVQRAASQALAAAVRTAEYQCYRSIVVRSSEPLGAWPAESHWHRHLLDLNRSYQAILQTYSSSMRRNLRHAEAAGMTFEVRTDQAAMDIFYRLHVITRQKLGVPVQPARWFAGLHQMLIARDLGFIGVVMSEGKPVAAAVFLTYKKNIIYKYGASDPSFLKQRPNELLLGGAIRWAVEQKFHVFDFGVSDKQQDGLAAFKRKFGAVESEAHHVFLAGTPRPMMQQWRARQLVSGLIRHSPSIVCRGLGKVLYKFSQ